MWLDKKMSEWLEVWRTGERRASTDTSLEKAGPRGWRDVKKKRRQCREKERGMNRWSGLGLFWCTMGLSACGYSMLQLTRHIYLSDWMAFPFITTQHSLIPQRWCCSWDPTGLKWFKLNRGLASVCVTCRTCYFRGTVEVFLNRPTGNRPKRSQGPGAGASIVFVFLNSHRVRLGNHSAVNSLLRVRSGDWLLCKLFFMSLWAFRRRVKTL